MIKIRALFFLSLSVLLLFTAFNRDEDPISVLVSKLESYIRSHPQEKVYLHMDKPYYSIGDDIWFKGYILNVGDSRLSKLSGILDVELINDQDSIVQYRKLPVENGLTWGDFSLPDSLAAGNYRIRAYTQLMRNLGPDFFFDKTIQVGNSWSNKVFVTAKYAYSKKSNADLVNAALQFKDEQEIALRDVPVNYEVVLDGDIVDRGKLKTNPAGELTLNFKKRNAAKIITGKIIAYLNLPGDRKVKKEVLIKSFSDDVDVQFFPEGGEMVNGLPSRVGIKSVNAEGLGEDISGTIVDNFGTEITTFQTKYLGLGSLVLSPEEGRTYSARVKFADGSEKNVALPASKKEGYVLSANNSDSNKVQVKVFLTPTLVKNQELKLMVQHSGNVQFVYRAQAKTQVVLINMPKKDLPSGIIQLTLFSGENTPVCERLIFNKNEKDIIQTSVTGASGIYNRRSAVDLNLNALDAGKPIQGNFSVAVTNADIVKPDLDNESNIMTSLLLTSDLKGYVEKPNYYFTDNLAQTNAELDNLMLTQGWRRFTWPDVLNESNATGMYPTQTSLHISGTLLTLGGKPMPNAKVAIFASNNGFIMLDTLSDANGHFNFDKLSFKDGTKFIVQARNPKDKKNVQVKLDVLPAQAVTRNINTGDIEVNMNESISAYIRKSKPYFDELLQQGLLKHTIQLKEVAIKTTKRAESRSSNLNGPGNADQTIKAEALGPCFNLLDCIKNRVPGLVVKKNTPYLIRSIDKPMLLLMDGLEVDSNSLTAFNPNDIESIEVLKSIGYTSTYGFRGAPGVLIITTKSGSIMNPDTYSPWIVTAAPKGFPPFRTFYSPVYTTTNTNNVKDLRTTVYWNPEVVTDANGKASIKFFTTDEPGNYRVVVEGINAQGQLGRTVYNYKVK